MENLNDSQRDIEWSLRSLAERQFPIEPYIKTAKGGVQNYQIDIPERPSQNNSSLTQPVEGSLEENSQVAVSVEIPDNQIQAKDSSSSANTTFTQPYLHMMKRGSKLYTKLPRQLPPRNPPLPPIDDEFKLSPLTTAAEVLAKDDFKHLERLIGLYKRQTDTN